MSKEVEALTVLLAARTADFERGMNTAERRIQKVERQMRGSTAIIERDAARMAAKVKGSFDQVGKSFNLSGAALGGIGLAALAKEGIQYSDAFTRIRNSLAVAGVEAGRQKSVQDALFASAQRNAAGFESLADVFGQASRNAKDLGADEQKLLQFTDGVAVAVKASGKSAEAASGALLQLGQLLGAGTVRAEEFNSVLEGAPTILTAVAAGMDGTGGSVAALRTKVLAGEVSSKQFFDAFLKGKPVIDDMAAKALPTAANAVTRINNALTKYVGENAGAQGATRALITGLNLLADNFQTSADVALQFAAVIAAALVGRSIVGMIASLGSAGLAIKGFITTLRAAQGAGGVAGFASALGGLGAAAGPIGAVLGVAAAAGIYYFSTRTSEAEKRANSYADALERVRDRAKEAGGAAQKSGDGNVQREINRLKEAGDNAQADFKDVRAELLKTLNDFAEGFDRLSRQPGKVSAAARASFRDAAAALKPVIEAFGRGEATADDVRAAVFKLANADPRFNALADKLDPLLDKFIELKAVIEEVGKANAALGKVAAGGIRGGQGASMGGAAQGEQNRAAASVAAVDKVATAAEIEAAKGDREKAIDKQTEDLAKSFEKENGRVVTAIERLQLRERAEGMVDSAETRKREQSFDDDALKSYVDRVVKAESGGNASAKNPYSTATGLGQFIESTWVDQFKKAFPDRAAGMSRAAILALRTDANTSRALIENYAKENASALRGAGLAVTEANLQLAHFLGAGGAIKALKADPNASASSVLGADVVSANRGVFKNDKVSDALDYADRRANATRYAAGDLTPAEQAQKKTIDYGKDFEKDAARKREDLELDLARTKAKEGFNFQIEKEAKLLELKREAQDAGRELDATELERIEARAQKETELAQAVADGEKLKQDAKKATADAARLAEEFESLGADVTKGIVADLRAGKSAAEAFSNALDKILTKLTDAAIDGLFSALFSGGTGGGGFLSSLFSGLSGGKAAGGRVSKGQVYPVGERGTELFSPGENGRIIPNSIKPQVPPMARTAPRGGGRIAFTSEINLTGANGDETIRRLAREESEKGTATALKAYDRNFGPRIRYEQTMNG